MSERRRLITVIAVSAAAVVVAATGAAGIGFLAENDGDTIVTHEPEPGSEGAADESTEATGDPEETDGPADEQADDESATGEEDMDSDLFQAGGKVLPRPMGGQQAIDTLGDELERVAEKNNRTVDELRDLLLRDKTLKITPSGFLVYGDTATPNPAAPPDADE